MGLDDLLAAGAAARPTPSLRRRLSRRGERVALALFLGMGFALVLLIGGLFLTLPAPEIAAPAVAELGLPERVSDTASRAERAASTVSDAARSMVAR